MGTICYLDTGNFEALTIRRDNLNERRLREIDDKVLKIDILIHKHANRVAGLQALKRTLLAEWELRDEKRRG